MKINIRANSVLVLVVLMAAVAEVPSVLSNELESGDHRDSIEQLQVAFEQATTLFEKQRFAAMLCSLGLREPYFDFIADEALKSVESGIPFPYEFDSDGAPNPQKYRRAFLHWVEEHSLDPEEAAREATYVLPSNFLFLVNCNGPRSIEILRLGLQSKNFVVASRAADALAKLGATDLIPAIVSTAESFPREVAMLFASALAQFEDVRALEAAGELSDDPSIKRAINERLQQRED